MRTFFPVHEFDNAFGGTKMIAGDIGTVINAGNREETGNFWDIQPCPAQDQDAEQLAPPATGPLAQLVNGPVASLLHGSPLPVYPSGPQMQHPRPHQPWLLPDLADDQAAFHHPA